MSLRRVGEMGVGSSEIKHSSIQQASGLPGPVQDLLATVTGVSTASLSWSAPRIPGKNGVSSYIVESSPSGGSASITGTTATVSGLSPTTSYVFSVTPQSSSGRGIFRNSESRTTSAYNSVTGGATREISNYDGTGQLWKVHTFYSSGSLQVTSNSEPFTVALIGGGGGGGPGNPFHGSGGAGGGGGGFEKIFNLNNQVYSFTIGAGGTGNGQSSTFHTLTCGYGGGGSGAQYIVDSGIQGQPGGAGSEGGTSNGGRGGRESGTVQPQVTVRNRWSLGSSGNGGYAGGQDYQPAGAGVGGALVIAYQIG